MVRFIAIALPWLFFLIALDVVLDAHSAGASLFSAGRLLFLLLPLYAGLVVIVFRLTGRRKD